MQIARDIMTRKILLARAEWTLGELAAFLDQHDITGAPVMDGEELAGLVSVTDIARAWPDRSSVTSSEELLRSIQQGGVDASEMGGFGIEAAAALTVGDVMTPVVFSVEEQTTVAEMASMMIRGRIHRVVVMRGREPVGIVSALDLLRVLQPHAEGLEAAS